MSSYTLSRGRHRRDSGLHCATELLSLAAGLGFTDHPPGVDNVLTNVVICLNDAAHGDVARTRLLLPYVLADPNDITAGPGALYGTADGRTKARTRILFGLRPADQLRAYIMRLARESDIDEKAFEDGRRLVNRLIDPYAGQDPDHPTLRRSGAAHQDAALLPV